MPGNKNAASKGTLITPAECLEQLPQLSPEPFAIDEENGLRRSELRHSLRGITQLNYVTESAQVRGLVEKILGRLPSLSE